MDKKIVIDDVTVIIHTEEETLKEQLDRADKVIDDYETNAVLLRQQLHKLEADLQMERDANRDWKETCSNLSVEMAELQQSRAVKRDVANHQYFEAWFKWIDNQGALAITVEQIGEDIPEKVVGLPKADVCYEVYRHILRGHKIHAIKKLRESVPGELSLKEAKETVDRIYDWIQNSQYRLPSVS